jgi:hypothetical protein
MILCSSAEDADHLFRDPSSRARAKLAAKRRILALSLYRATGWSVRVVVDWPLSPPSVRSIFLRGAAAIEGTADFQKPAEGLRDKHAVAG